MKMTITQPRKVQIPKFWCLKSSTNIWQSCGNIYSIPKTQKIDWEGKQISKLAKIGQFFALKKLKMNFLKNFPGFYFKSFLCVFLYVSMNFSHWQNLCDTPDLVCSLHRHRDLTILPQASSDQGDSALQWSEGETCLITRADYEESLFIKIL